MTEAITWAKSLITSYYPEIEIEDGIDFNGDRKIDAEERFGDLNENGEVGDAEDYLLYLKANRPYIERVIEFVGYQGPLSPHNIIHQILFIESEMFSPEENQRAYQILNEILAAVKERPIEMMTPEAKLKLVYAVLKEKGFKLLEQEEDTLFISNLLEGELDCDTSSFVVLAVAQELGWPVKIVSVPRHAFVRWEGEDIKLNIDYGNLRADNYYHKRYSWDGTVLDLNGIISLAYCNRGHAKDSLGRPAEAIADYDEAIRLDPELAMAYNNRGYAKLALGRDEEAARDLKRAEELRRAQTP